MKLHRIWVGGTFDLFHLGHVELFRRASQFGDVIAILNTDEFATRYKRRPIMTLKERSACVEACKYVKWVDVNVGCEDATPSLLYWKPSLILHGDDWQGDSLFTQMGISQDFLDDNAIEMLYLPYSPGVSSSEIRRRVIAQAVGE